jgi:hypothetical protein
MKVFRFLGCVSRRFVSLNDNAEGKIGNTGFKESVNRRQFRMPTTGRGKNSKLKIGV